MFHSPQLERIVAGIRQLRGEAGTRERQPITKDILLEILVRFDPSTKGGAVFRAAFCLAFPAFLRVGEFTYLHIDRQAKVFGQ